MIEIVMYRHGHELFRSGELTDLSLDGIRYSGIEYYIQEARELRVSLLFNSELQDILEGDQRLVYAGWMAMLLTLVKDGEVIFSGMVRAGGYSLEWLGGGQRLCEICAVDTLGWILSLAEGVTFHIDEGYLDPAKKVCEIITAVIAPVEDREDFPAAEVNLLRQAVGPFNWQNAWVDFDYSRWLPYHLFRQVLLDSRAIELSISGGWNVNRKVFGFVYEGNDLRLVFWQYCKRYARPYQEQFRLRKYAVRNGSIAMIEELDLTSDNASNGLEIPEEPTVAGLVLGIGNHSIEDGRAYYSGPGSLESVEVVAGDYDAKDLMGEYLRLLNAVLVSESYSMHIRNRINEDSPAIAISDVLEANLEHGDADPAEITAVSLASQAIIDGVNGHYKELMRRYPHEVEIKTHELILGGVRAEELLVYRLNFEGYEILPTEVSRDYVTGEVEIRGRGRRS